MFKLSWKESMVAIALATIWIVFVGVMAYGCGTESGDYRGSECSREEVVCFTGECCPRAHVCCSDQNMLWPVCCPVQAPVCDVVGGMVACLPVATDE